MNNIILVMLFSLVATLQSHESTKSIELYLEGLPNLPSEEELSYIKATKVDEKTLRNLGGDSDQLYNAYEWFLTTDAHSHVKINEPMVVEAWRDAVRKDILRRGKDAQEIIEKIYIEEGFSQSILTKLEIFFPDIDKRPFIKILMKTLENGQYKKLPSDLLGIKVEFIAKHGSLSDLEFLDKVIIERDLAPYALSLVEKRRSELPEKNSESTKAIPQENKVVPRVITEESTSEEAETVKNDHLLWIMVGGVAVILSCLFIAFKGNSK